MNQLTSFITALCFVGVLLATPKRLGAQQVEQMMQARPVVLSGSMDATAIFYSSTGITPRYLPFNYFVAGSPVLSLYGWQVPFNFIIGKQQNNFTQPFNQFGLSPSYKWITVHAGYRSLSFSPFTLAGHTFLGAGVELAPGKFRFAFLYGQFNKATPLDTAQAFYFSGFSYNRKGMAVKVGFGTQENYFDLIALKARDDPGSVRGGKGMADSLGITPAENMVTGYSMRLSIWKRHLSLESDGAISIYNSDIRAPRLHDSAFENEKWVSGLATVNTSSEVYGAVQAALRYKTRNFSVRLQYRHIDPGYQTMGAYYLNNDLENYTIAPAFALLRSRLRFSGSIGFQQDDLANKKRSRSNKIIGSANLSAEISAKLGFDASYSNYSVSQTVKTIRFADSLKVVESSSQFSLSPRYIVGGAAFSHSFLFSANISQARELNPARLEPFNSDIDTYNYLLNYQLSLTRRYASVFLSLNKTDMKGASLTDGNMGVTLGGTKAWEKDRLSLSVTGGYLFSKRNEEKGRILTGSMQARYHFIGKHVLHLTAYYTANRPDRVTAYYPKYTETRGEIGYGLSF